MGKRRYRNVFLLFCPERPKWDQNQKFTPLSETTSIPGPDLALPRLYTNFLKRSFKYSIVVQCSGTIFPMRKNRTIAFVFQTQTSPRHAMPGAAHKLAHAHCCSLILVPRASVSLLWSSLQFVVPFVVTSVLADDFSCSFTSIAIRYSFLFLCGGIAS